MKHPARSNCTLGLLLFLATPVAAQLGETTGARVLTSDTCRRKQNMPHRRKQSRFRNLLATALVCGLFWWPCCQLCRGYRRN